MPKPNFAALKKPILTPEQESFIDKGPGKDKKVAAKLVAKSDEMHRLSIDVPMDAFLRFKVACTMSRKKMGPEILAFIERRTAELEEEKR